MHALSDLIESSKEMAFLGAGDDVQEEREDQQQDSDEEDMMEVDGAMDGKTPMDVEEEMKRSELELDDIGIADKVNQIDEKGAF